MYKLNFAMTMSQGLKVPVVYKHLYESVTNINMYWTLSTIYAAILINTY
jgi:hypothetical protein